MKLGCNWFNRVRELKKMKKRRSQTRKPGLDPLRDPHAPACPRALLRPRAHLRPRARMRPRTLLRPRARMRLCARLCPRACLRPTRVRLGRFKPINLVFGPVQAVSVGFSAGSKFLGVVLYYTKLIM